MPFIRPVWGGGIAPPSIIQYQETEYDGAAVGSITAIVPSSPAPTAGQLMVITCVSRNTAPADSFNALAGWTMGTQQGSSSSNVHATSYWKIATGSDSNETITWVGSSPNTLVMWYIIDKFDTDQPIEGDRTHSSFGTAKLSHPVWSPTVAKDGCLAIAFYGLAGSASARSFTYASTNDIFEELHTYTTGNWAGFGSATANLESAAGVTLNVSGWNVTPVNATTVASYGQIVVRPA